MGQVKADLWQLWGSRAPHGPPVSRSEARGGLDPTGMGDGVGGEVPQGLGLGFPGGKMVTDTCRVGSLLV